ncbi:MAG: SDR family NAD(P)-dependent oxidoreductase [Methylobacteriaceae bacterium]|nr:SDR family NAD(P)-dependent oxidoreductase [Methylobacteriaceae bacterium]
MRRVALVTGASRGLGAALARFLGRLDYDLVLTARGAEELASVAESIREIGVSVHALAGDVVDASHRARLVEAAWSLGRLNLLINNASALGPSPMPSLAEYSLADFEAVLRTNVVAPLALAQVCLPLLSGTQGLIVNLSSDAATGGYPGWGGYGASKAALDLVSLTLAKELAEAKVAVVSVDPGDMRTAMHQAAFPGQDISDRPPPEATLPFWAWLLGQPHEGINGRRFRAQGEVWEAAA